LVEDIINQVLEAQAAEQLKAKPYERTEERQGYRNGHRDKLLKSRVGELTLMVPRLRSGYFSTELFKRYQRSEQALLLAMVKMVANGVSTRKVRAVVEELCGTEFSKSTVSGLCKGLGGIVKEWQSRDLSSQEYPFSLVDALVVRVRKGGRVRLLSVLIATGINRDGYREVLGLFLGDSESEAAWAEFFGRLKGHGLKGVDLVVSDDHTGLVNAIELLNETIDAFGARAPKAVERLEAGFEDAMAVMAPPQRYRKRLRTTNGVERLNQEIRRRERVIRIFPNEESAFRLIGAVLVEIDEAWSSGSRYFDMAESWEWVAATEKQRKEVSNADTQVNAA
jgi:transposase-like protein